jgi:hypothetical protein
VEAKGGSFSLIDFAKAWTRKLLRIAPVYYAIFFIGWGLFARTGDGPVWYLGELLFENCPSTWWAQLLFIGNLYPGF